MKNTGNIDWSEGSFTVRLGTPSSTVKEVTAPWGGADAGTGAVFQCSYGTDNINCREKIVEEWSLQEVNGQSPDGYSSRVAVFNLGSIAVGQSKSVDIQLTIPQGTTGDRVLIGNGIATTQKITVIGYVTETISPGNVIGEVMYLYLGAALVLGGGFRLLKGGAA